MTLLTLNNVSAHYGAENILHGVTIEVAPAEIVALIGPNGAGKSTVLKSIFDIATVASGTITFQETDITGLPTHKLLKHGISYVPQGRINFSTLSIEENLRIGNTSDEEDLKRRLEAVYTRFPVLKEKRSQLAYSLSGGQHQMLALGRALMHEPQVLLMDEPSLGLSPKLIKELFAMIEELRQDGIAILLVEQNAKQAIQAADRTYVLEQGKVVLSGDKSITQHKKIKTIYLGGDIDE